MKRLRFGPDVQAGTIHAPRKPDAKTDVNITINAVQVSTYPASVTFSPDAYSPDTHVPLLLVHFVGVPSGQERPATPDAALSDAFVIHTKDVSGVVDGSPIEATLPNLASDTDYTILTVLEDDPA